MYLININDLIKNIEEIHENVKSIKEQFYDIIHNVSVSNFESINAYGNLFSKSYDSILLNKDEYKKSINEYQSIYKKIKDKEEEIINEYKKAQSLDDVIKRNTMSIKFQKEIDQIFYSKNDIIKKGMILVSKYQKNLLTLEEVSFDNSIMIDRVYKNFDQLKELL